ncbi:MAG: VIT1/CCC1 transporter family protein [Acidobacteria bacterium]|nr:VIT1/CCC1 transporter family protein [Acidobacteriota bacterium]
MAASPEDVRRWREFWADEMAGAALYRAVARATPDDRRRGVLLELAGAEERHAAHWAALLGEAGVRDLAAPRPPFRVRALGFLARRFGSAAVLPIVLKLEVADSEKYAATPDAAAGMSRDEKAHGQVVAAMAAPGAGQRILRSEGRHRAGAGGALRASVFGINDGLVSNLSLVMGVAGGTGNGRFVLLAGVAGLLAGAFSMAAGEWISVRSQRELYEREIRVEREELARFPEEEREELALIYRAKGIDDATARALAGRIMSTPETALDTLAREELGLDPADLASPGVAAGASFAAFAVGAIIPVVPYLVGSGTAAFVAAAVASGAALLGIGAGISILTGRGALRSGLRMVAVGAAAAAATYGVGRAIGVSVS